MTDVTEFEKLWLRSESLLTNYARKKADYHLVTPDDVTDLIQQTRIRAFTAFDQFDRARSFEAWVTRIFQNLFLDHLRRQKSHPVCVSLDQSFPTEIGNPGRGLQREITDSRPGPERLFLDGCLSEELSTALGKLSLEHRLTLKLISDGLSYEEIGREMGVRLGTVRSRIHRARKQMRCFQLGAGIVHQPSRPRAR